MTRFSPVASAAALSFLLTAQNAVADVTPQDVWADWQDYFQGMGYALTASEDATRGKLTVSDIQFGLAMAPDDGQVFVSFDQIDFVQNDDGTVSVVMPDAMPVTIEVAPAAEDADTVQAALTISQTGQDMRVSGTPNDMTSTYTAGSLGFTLDQLVVDDDMFGAENAMATVFLNNVQSTSRSAMGQLRAYSQDGRIGSARFDMRFKNPDEPAIAVLSGTTTDVAVKSNGLLPLGLAQVSDMVGMLRAGMVAEGVLTSGNSTFILDIEDPVSGNLYAAAAADSSTLAVKTSANGLSYAGTRQNITLSVQPPEIPFLLSFGLENAAFNLSAPVLQSDTSQNFAMGLNIEGFTMSDMVWGMINPQGTLRRDPATITLDLTGTATLLMDYFAPETAEKLAQDGTLPVRLDGLNLNALIVDAMGARLTGNGAVTFDNSVPVADPLALAPTGAIDLKLVGGSALLDALVASGLLPAQTAMGARMMMGMFAQPAGDDTLTSKLEFTRDGSILANGQRIR